MARRQRALSTIAALVFAALLPIPALADAGRPATLSVSPFTGPESLP